MADEPYDYSQDTDAVGDNLLAQISATAQSQIEAQQAVDAAEAVLAEKKNALKEIKERTLPELMAAAQQKEITTSGGLVVKIEEVVRASIPKDGKPLAFSWLHNNGHGSTIKNQVTIDLPRGSDELVKQIVSAVHTLSPSLLVDVEQSVHSSTLAALVRELLSEEKEVPLDILGAHIMISSKVTPQKTKRSSTR